MARRDTRQCTWRRPFLSSSPSRHKLQRGSARFGPPATKLQKNEQENNIGTCGIAVLLGSVPGKREARRNANAAVCCKRCSLDCQSCLLVDQISCVCVGHL